MGTRSLTYVYTDHLNEPMPVVCMYRHYDGYPSGHGAELATFLKNADYVDIMCLAASMVSHFKKLPYNYYLYPVNLNQDCWQDYEYHVYDKTVKVTTKQQKDILFDGVWSDFEEFCVMQHSNG